ncbi:uncharacterized protein LOC107669132 [Sinocyclocheilus anshuiensis]|uniref:uncharacterized protein LOC107669132 n=1 Tax=Sinocyclocheilus anshuiensis TaxID=1608454 RepID=UPI0007B906F3|nr:PREDICTED: uncharacterized protein LOC107669132 [Sinocyclocheilus anshuiensis]
MRRGDWLPWPGEAQRRDERRAETRLAEGLQRLDQAKHYHLNTLTREQRRLHRDLISIKTGNPWKRGIHSLGLRPSNHDVGRPAASYKRTLLPIIPMAGKETDSHRSSSLQARVQEFMSSGEKRAEHSSETLCLPDLKRQPVASLTATSTNTEREENKERDMDGEQDRDRGAHMDIVRDREKHSQKDREWMLFREREKANERGAEIHGNRCPFSPVSFPSEMLAPDEHLRTVHMLPNFAQALAEARKSRHIRHRGQPLCERELTIREIFAQDSRAPAH